MKISIKTMQRTEHSFDISGPDATIGEVRAQADSVLGSTGITLIHKGQVLKDDSATLAAVGIAEGEMLVALAKKAKTEGAFAAGSPMVALASPPAAAAPTQIPAAVPHNTTPPVSAPAPATAAPATPFVGSGTMISLTIADTEGDVRSIEVESNESIENVKALLEVEFNVPLARQQLMHDGKILTDAQRINDAGIKDHDMLMMQQVQAAFRPPASSQGGPLGAGGLFGGLFGNMGRAPPDPLQRFMGEADQLIQMMQMDPHMKTRIMERDKELGAALEKGDKTVVAHKLMEISKQKMDNEARKRAAIMRLNADPLDVEAQKEIENAIAMENINENLESAMEYNPEAFGRVIMLYVPCEVNGVPIKAFVDSGAQMTIMSQPIAEKLGVMRLCDKRYSGIAKGVGSSKIVGKVHACNMKLGTQHFTISITILEDNSMDFLFGLDNLKRHQCCIDLKDNVLRIGNDAVAFLSESDLPSSAKESFGGGDAKGMDAEMSDAAGAAGGAADFPSETVQRFTNMGFSEEQAVTALRQSGGDPELAASMLLAGFD